MSDINHLPRSPTGAGNDVPADDFSDIKEMMLKNQRVFARESPFLDALLVFAGLFSAILAAFLIEVHKGLEEDVLVQILHQLQKSDDTFQPSTISIWVNGLWFASLAISLASAIFVILAKGMGRRVLEKEEIEDLFAETDGGGTESSSPGRSATDKINLYTKLQPGGGGNKIVRSGAHKAFKRKFEFLTMSAIISISISLALFYPGLVVLVYADQKGIGLSVAAIGSGMALFTFASVLHDVWSAAQHLDPLDND